MRFDEAYYRRLYRDPATRVQTGEEVAHIARAVTSLFDWWRYPLRSMLDVGAGTGEWGAWMRANRPGVPVRSVDVSEYACRTWGHEQADIATWNSGELYDLVVCQGVLGYLDDDACAAAVGNLGKMTRGFLWIWHTTQTDLDRGVVDRERTDLSVRLRPAHFYLDLLSRWYVPVGAGLFMAHDLPLPLFALERPAWGETACP